MVDHGHLARQELGGQVGPLHDAGGHAHILVLQVQPQLERLDVFGGVEVDFLAVGAHQAHAVGAVLQGEAREGPLGGAGVERDAHAVAVFIGQLLGILDHFIPGGRRRLRIKPHFLKGILVVEHDHRGALEGDGVDAAVHVGVQHEAVDEVVHEGLAFGVGGDQVVQRHGHLGIGHGEALGGQAHEQVGRVAALDGGLDGRHRVVVVAGVDGLHLHIGVLGVEVGGHLVDELGRIAAYVDGEVHRKLQRLFRQGGKDRGAYQRHEHEHESEKFFHGGCLLMFFS